MTKRSYPYKAWILQPSFKPVEVELVGHYSDWGSHQDWDRNQKGKAFNVKRDLYPNKAAAIAAGRKKIEEQQADIAKRLERINKRIAALDKAEKS
ncbi:hypothetical protein [Stutzerimonas stutzeri]|uniref:Uncharacterized protein n=1 Tax=Stutzerimonas stutzeri TaxID=316 RepID=A0AA42TGT2_STUST|nr:hypothetical protein [Stutzerimonas stutzeri]MDH1236550.1 hypothetical protein [Stutzerimonas stutzeri]